jgi:predicted DNA-binding transcriptional regulator AlpA
MINTIKNLLLQIVDKIDKQEITSNEDETMEVVKMIKQYTDTDRILSKYMAHTYLGISRASFDKLVAEGKIPKGKKVSGFKELQWNLKDLKRYKEAIE